VSVSVIVTPIVVTTERTEFRVTPVVQQGLPGREGAALVNPPIFFTATEGQTIFTVPRVLSTPVSARLFVNGVQHTYAQDWNYSSSTSVLTWINSAFDLSGTDDIVLYE
jgi:hypothetical protein